MSERGRTRSGERASPLARLNRPGWKILGVVLLAGAGWVGGPALGRRLDFFRVRRVELAGVRYLEPRAVLAALRLPRRASVFDDLAVYERRAAALPGATKIAVRRRLPGTLRVEVTETVPVALAQAPRGVVMVDARGKVLPFDPRRSAPDLPVAAAPDSVVAMLLDRLRELEPATYAQVSAAWRLQDDVVLEVGGRRLLFRPDASAEEIRAVMAVAQDLVRQNRNFRELDGRFAGQVVVRGLGPAPKAAAAGAAATAAGGKA
ncbi:MAG TPA: FtsQ-type POTRA domain-containing protein [Gemmatimonadales bacterium]|nr:FtsQ-type POTRA domain-containing protein [Gemmatimonadales bacterium]